MTIILVLGIIVAILLMLVILVQNPKGGGLASNFSQGNQIFGVEKTTDIVEKITWGAAILIFVISLLAASFTPKGKSGKDARQTTERSK
ncbi:MAG: preprotein translocase subunit SecG [Bacteroidetes bacterium]|nr:preprotein translocase subunit SecG [Bacteroidota bacterium]